MATTAASKEQQAMHQEVIKGTLERVANHRGVLGYAVLSPKDGHIFDFKGFGGSKSECESVMEKLNSFLSVAQSTVRLLDHQDELTFLRIRSVQREFILAPDYLNKEYVVVIVHDQLPEEKEDKIGAKPDATLSGSQALNETQKPPE